ncbi:hypothetical protein [Helicobacter ailurogastricus]|uniref:hypothetical protein n=1 Tax=Helicobacter ailurogastricus TaxID=1578720 RepID=UPI0025578368|nr:hypothetical protein [Helicobacter ailurogastricus]
MTAVGGQKPPPLPALGAKRRRATAGRSESADDRRRRAKAGAGGGRGSERSGEAVSGGRKRSVAREATASKRSVAKSSPDHGGVGAEPPKLCDPHGGAQRIGKRDPASLKGAEARGPNAPTTAPPRTTKDTGSADDCPPCWPCWRAPAKERARLLPQENAPTHKKPFPAPVFGP